MSRRQEDRRREGDVAIAGAAATRPTESAATDAIVMYAAIKTSLRLKWLARWAKFNEFTISDGETSPKHKNFMKIVKYQPRAKRGLIRLVRASGRHLLR